MNPYLNASGHEYFLGQHITSVKSILDIKFSSEGLLAVNGC